MLEVAVGSRCDFEGLPSQDPAFITSDTKDLNYLATQFLHNLGDCA